MRLEQKFGGKRFTMMRLASKTFTIIQIPALMTTTFILACVPKNPTFDFDFEGYAPSASTSYTLVVGTDPWFSGKTIDTAVSGADGSITLNGDVELSTDLKDKKVWLVLTADWNEAGMTAWNPTQYLFETGLIWYDDTNL